MSAARTMLDIVDRLLAGTFEADDPLFVWSGKIVSRLNPKLTPKGSADYEALIKAGWHLEFAGRSDRCYWVRNNS